MPCLVSSSRSCLWWCSCRYLASRVPGCRQPAMFSLVDCQHVAFSTVDSYKGFSCKQQANSLSYTGSISASYTHTRSFVVSTSHTVNLEWFLLHTHSQSIVVSTSHTVYSGFYFTHTHTFSPSWFLLHTHSVYSGFFFTSPYPLVISIPSCNPHTFL